jgi:hypothetical protein
MFEVPGSGRVVELIKKGTHISFELVICSSKF